MKKKDLLGMHWYAQMSRYGGIHSAYLLVSRIPIRWDYKPSAPGETWGYSTDPVEDQLLMLAPGEKSHRDRAGSYSRLRTEVDYLAIRVRGSEAAPPLFGAAEKLAREILEGLRRHRTIRIGDLDIPQELSLHLVRSRELTHTWDEARRLVEESEKRQRAETAAYERQLEQYRSEAKRVQVLAEELNLGRVSLVCGLYGECLVTLKAADLINLGELALKAARVTG